MRVYTMEVPNVNIFVLPSYIRRVYTVQEIPGRPTRVPRKSIRLHWFCRIVTGSHPNSVRIFLFFNHSAALIPGVQKKRYMAVLRRLQRELDCVFGVK